MSKDAHTVDGEAGTDRTEAAEKGSSGAASRGVAAKTGTVTKLAAAAGVAALAAGGAVAAGNELLGDAGDPIAGQLSDEAAEKLITAVPALEALEDLLPDPPEAESDTTDSTGATGRLRFEVVEPPRLSAAAGDDDAGTAPLRPRGVGAVAVADGGRTARRPTGDRSSQRRPGRAEDPSEESSRERPGGPRSGVLGAPETSGGPERPTPGEPEPDVASGVGGPDPTETPDAPEPGTSPTPDTPAPGATPETPGPEITDPSAAGPPPESSNTAPESGAESP